MNGTPGDLERLLAVGRRTCERLATLPGVVAIAQGGSSATGSVDEHSDVDLYVYCDQHPPAELRLQIAHEIARAGTANVDHGYFEGGDAWDDRATDISVDVMYCVRPWIEERVAAVLERHEPSLGYSTAILFNVQNCIPLRDDRAWLRRLKERSNRPYPDKLADAIVAFNYPMLRTLPFSYRRELSLAAGRADVPAAVHVSNRFLASYFDILFALNHKAHPGEKRLIESARALAVVPDDFAPQATCFLAQASSEVTVVAAVATMDELIAGLETLL